MEQALVLAQFLAQTDFNDLPHSALQAGKRGLLDCLGTAIGGANSQAAEMALNLIDEAGGALQATLLARGKRTSLRDAVLFNATAAHALDYDDTLSAPAAMVALAVAEQRSLPGRELLRSYVLGFEVASRMTRAIGGWENARGWHMMGVAGVFGAATAASLLLKLNPPQIIAALGVAATQSSGLMAMHGFLAKPFHSGKPRPTASLPLSLRCVVAPPVQRWKAL